MNFTFPAGVWVLAGHNWTPPGSGYSPPVQQMKRLGQTHLAHMLTLSLTHFAFYPFFLARTVSKHQALLLPHFPSHNTPPPMLPSYWSALNPIAWHLSCFCKWQNLSEASCWLLRCTSFFFCPWAPSKKNIFLLCKHQSKMRGARKLNQPVVEAERQKEIIQLLLRVCFNL